MVQVIGDDGPVVLLLPGGAEAVDGFFPGLVEGLLADPGCRVILHDRPGTGTSAEEGSLATATRDLHAMLGGLGLGPVVAIGQSLGGAVAALLARDHPEDVAGLVLLDPSPVNDPALATRLNRTMRATEAIARTPVVGRLVPALLRSSTRRLRRTITRPDAHAAMDRTLAMDVPKLGRAAAGLDVLARDFREVDLPRIPAAVVTADREAESPIRQAHQRLALALDTKLLTWPKADHSVHLTHPDEVLAVCRDVVARTR
jgi:pimeloyl-ACP methyl ester carboxylesterase